jgi:hypothetical protein
MARAALEGGGTSDDVLGDGKVDGPGGALCEVVANVAGAEDGSTD